MYKLCPFLSKTLTIYNKKSDFHTIHIGINATNDNDISYTEFLPCIEASCMLFDCDTGECKYGSHK